MMQGITAAHPAVAETPWPLRDRLAWLRRFRTLLASDQQHLTDLIQAEVGKPPFEALTSDLMPLLASCRWHERRAARLLRPRRLPGRAAWQLGQSHWIERAPIGRVGIIATWNYPVQLLGIQLVQALLAGNHVVVKPSEHTPRTQQHLLSLAVDAGLPPDRLTWVEPTREAGARLLREHHLDHVVFTGSTSVGRSIAEWAAGTLTPTTLELSGCDTALVLADADPTLAARAIWAAVTLNAGQTCMAPRRALVHRDVYPAFARALATLAAAAKPLTMITEHAARHCFALAQEAIAAGGRSGSAVLEPPAGRAMRPIAVLECPADAALVAGEHFGPVLAVVPVTSRDEAIAIHRRCPKHLSSSIYTRSRRSARTLAATLGASHITINDSVIPTAHPGAPLGGRGESGWGVTRGVDGLLAMTRAVHVSSTSALIRPPADAPTDRMLQQMRAMVGWLYGRARSGVGHPADAVARHSPSPSTATHSESAVHGSA